jgi:hypothetical protein
MTTKTHEAPHYAICSGLLLPLMLVLNIFLSTLLSNILCPLATHKLTQQVPLPYNTSIFSITYSKKKVKNQHRTLLFTVVIKTLTEDLFSFERNLYIPIVICTPLLLKSGAAPLH